MTTHRRWFRSLAAAGAAVVLVAPTLAEARGDFHMSRGARMNIGGGIHARAGGFNPPAHLSPRLHPVGPHPNVHPQPHPAPHPAPHPGPHPAPHPPAPGPHPPAPGPHPPHPGPHPHPPPPPPPPAPYWPGYWHDDDDFWWGAAAAIAIGSIVASVPPDCQTVSVNGVSYKHCGTTWLRPEYQGHNLVYVVVGDPR